MGKNYAIIGGTSGIGQASVARLLASGHSLYAASRRPEQLQQLGIPTQFFDALAPTPLTWPDKLDGFVYFPGSITLKPFHRLNLADFIKDIHINLLGAVHALQSALPALKASSEASVVLFSTVAVDQGMPFHASIAAAKGALEALARSLAAEWAPLIRVNVIAPSLTDTPLAGTLLSDETKRSASAKRHPMQRIGNADDVAQMVEFLLSDASRFMTGQTLRPDGGLSSVKLFT
jgi:NAD(P)-dependent dehydrogenase (short-subunit alcohol dehydrogenase family)